MRKFFQTEWHGIYFKDIQDISSTEIAGPAFYKAFYREFFKKYEFVSELNPDWVKLKQQNAHFLSQRLEGMKNNRVLSVGCGLGIIEQILINEGYYNLEMIEVSEDSVQWIKENVPDDKLHIGFFPQCLQSNYRFDVIYLCSVEYFYDQQQFINLLKDIKCQLNQEGRCIMISNAYHNEFPVQGGINLLKDFIKLILEKLSLRPRGQFWGYMRNSKEFYQAMQMAGFNRLVDGLLGKDTYWIEGRNG